MSSSTKKKARSQSTRSSRLYRPGESSGAVTDHRLFFLSAIRRIREAHARFVALSDPDTMKLALRDFQVRRRKEPSAELERRIEDWAIGIHLARKPIRDWWIFEVAVDWLRTLISGPPDMPVAGDADGYAWDSYCGQHVSLPVIPPQKYTFDGYDPSWEDGPDYRRRTLRAFEIFLDKYMRHQRQRYKAEGYFPAPRLPAPREPDSGRLVTKYQPLVRYQILGHGFSEIAGRADAACSLRVKVIQLRKLIGLPQLRPAGRPRAKL